MAGIKLDGAGTAKMVTLDEALALTQALHAVVERMAMDVRNGVPISGLMPALKRTGNPLAAKLKAQYGMISDQVTQMILGATRGGGGGDQVKVRSLREGVAQVRIALEIAVNKVKEQHAMEKHGGDTADTAGAASH